MNILFNTKISIITIINSNILFTNICQMLKNDDNNSCNKKYLKHFIYIKNMVSNALIVKKVSEYEISWFFYLNLKYQYILLLAGNNKFYQEVVNNE